MIKPKQLMIKIISVGNSLSGKSCLIKRYCEGKFVQRYITTIGVDYGVKKMKIKDRVVSINFFDISGDEDYTDIRTKFYKNTQGCLLVFDMDNRDSFLDLKVWEKEMVQNGLDKSSCVVYVVGNKKDIGNKAVEPREVNKYCKKRGFYFMQTSALTGENVNKVRSQH